MYVRMLHTDQFKISEIFFNLLIKKNNKLTIRK